MEFETSQKLLSVQLCMRMSIHCKKNVYEIGYPLTLAQGMILNARMGTQQQLLYMGNVH